MALGGERHPAFVEGRGWPKWEKQMRSVLTLVTALGFLVGRAVADDIPGTKGEAVTPTAKLPAHVAAPPGQLSLVADFKKKGDLGVPLYLVNRTGKPVELFTHNGQPFLAVEYEAEPGKWKPARAMDYALCGNSLGSLKLPDETFTTAYGYLAPVGFKAKVRYRFDGVARPLSNAGEGMVSHDDLSYLLVSKTSDFGLLSKVALGEFIPPAETANVRPLAIRRLAEASFDRDKAEAVLKRIVEGADKEYARIAEGSLEFMRKFRDQ
jgi:hypothetical protein